MKKIYNTSFIKNGYNIVIVGVHPASIDADNNVKDESYDQTTNVIYIPRKDGGL